MDKQASLIFEVGTEELPPNALLTLSEAFKNSVEESLKKASLTFTAIKSYATPRRLALLITDLDTFQQDQLIERKGPSLEAAYDKDGSPTKAAQGFAKSCGVAVSDLRVEDTSKGKWLTYSIKQQGQSATEILPDIFDKALAQLPAPKRMRWGSSSVEFVRPVHWILFLLGDQVVQCQILGVSAGNITYGHRFHSFGVLPISSAQDYEQTLAQHFVVADFNQRLSAIEMQVEEAAKSLGGKAVVDPCLLKEVAALVEYPQPIVGEFDRKYLKLPKEVLISSMKKHQKYFHAETEAGELLPNFITITNVKSIQPEVIRQGNERVIRPRLEDAGFFWNQDNKTTLWSRVGALQQILFQKDLGSLYDRTLRIKSIALFIANSLPVDKSLVARAADLSKTDLLTEMVSEFPDLQGVMGQCYAIENGEPVAVATALQEQYWPRFSGDQLPTTEIGLCLALADRIELLTGIFGIGNKPTGDKDPFGLRRAALGVVRMLIEKSLPISLQSLLDVALKALGDRVKEPDTAKQVSLYLIERAKGYFAESGFSTDYFEAVQSSGYTDLANFASKMQAVKHFMTLEASVSLSAANKRVRNILKKTDEAIPAQINKKILTMPAEIALNDAISVVSGRVEPLLAAKRYAESLTVMSELRDAVDQFFNDVLVMDEDKALRLNRLSLLKKMSELFLNIADLSKIQTQQG